MRVNEAVENAKIRQAYVNAVPDICDVILSDCKQVKGQVIMVEETKKKKNTVKYIMAAAACLMLFIGGGLGVNGYRVSYMVASTVSLEVNPSVEITVNKKERVLDVKALNKDGEIIIGDMDFSGSNINVVVNALIGSMLRNGYLNELANSILISVDNDDPAKGAALQERLTKEVNDILASDGFFGAVLSQTLTESADLQKQADLYGITLGKAQLINQILNSTQGHTFEELAPLSINELNLLITKAGSDMEKVSALGNASDKAYIGEMKALEIALAHAGISETDIMTYTMDMDVENGAMIYEIEFQYGGYEYEYDIDARTGKIVKYEKEIHEDETMGVAHEKFMPESSVQVNETADHYYYESEHHYEPEHNSSYNNGYIGEMKALGIALAHAGISETDIMTYTMDMDVENGVMVYEIEFKYNGFEYEYDIDAQTGEIVKNKKEIDDDAPVGADKGTVPEAVNPPNQTNTDYSYGTEHHYEPGHNGSHHK